MIIHDHQWLIVVYSLDHVFMPFLCVSRHFCLTTRSKKDFLFPVTFFIPVICHRLMAGRDVVNFTSRHVTCVNRDVVTVASLSDGPANRNPSPPTLQTPAYN